MIKIFLLLVGAGIGLALFPEGLLLIKIVVAALALVGGFTWPFLLAIAAVFLLFFILLWITRAIGFILVSLATLFGSRSNTIKIKIKHNTED